VNALPDTLVCFAVKQEGKPFARTKTAQSVRILFTGMGAANAQRAIETELARGRPGRVLSGGFAGGLAPELAIGTVLFSSNDVGLTGVLQSAGALPARFHCAERVASTAREKRELREQTGADAVEMESGIISELCRQQGIPNAIIRVVLDTATEDLPLDFNALMSSRREIAPGKLALALLKQPQKIVALLRLQRRSAAAARALARVLTRVVEN
jgi:nucleoside phosphorylase